MGFKLTKKKTKRRKRNRVVMHLNNFFKPKLERLLYSLLQAIFSCLNLPRLTEFWAHPRSFSWFDMVEAKFTYGNKTSEKMVELVNIFYRSFPKILLVRIHRCERPLLQIVD